MNLQASQTRWGKVVRWAGFAVLGLALLLILYMVLFPRLLGDMSGLTALEELGAEERETWVVWESTARTSPQPEARTPAQASNPGQGDQALPAPEPGGDAATMHDPIALPPLRGRPTGSKGGFRAPRVLYQEWPRPGKVDGGNGTLRFRVRVGADGSVLHWELMSGFDCAPCLAEAERILAGLRFRPGLEDGLPTASWTDYSIHFHAGEDS